MGLEPWYVRRQIAHYQAGIRGTDPRDLYGMQMAPMARTLADAQALENVIAHIATLPDTAPEQTVVGDAARGRATFSTCTVCHGPGGEGRWNTNAPRLAGMSDWYLARQLANFRDRIRGGHAEDIYGDQMNLIVSGFDEQEAIDDVVAYINTLR